VKPAGAFLLRLFLSLQVLCGPLLAATPLLRLKGSHLCYSYDLNQIYGENVEFEFLGYRVTSRYLIINIVNRSFCAYGQVVLAGGTERSPGDEFWFSPKEPSGVLLTYGSEIGARYFGKAEEKTAPSLIREIRDVSWTAIQKSMFYMTAKTIEITGSYEVYGRQVRLYVEGARSIGFRKLNLTTGLSRRFAGLSVDKIWFNRTQGLIARLSHSYDSEGRFSSQSQIHYEERSLLKNTTGLNRQIDLMTAMTANLAKRLTLSVNGNYNSSSLWSMNAALSKQWSETVDTRFDLTYNKPVLFKGEAWLGLQTDFAMKELGDIAFGGRYGSGNQLVGNVAYSNLLFKRIRLLVTGSYSRFGIVGSGASSRILSSNISASYSSRVFNLSTDYYLNRDLVGSQKLSQPRLTLSLNQFDFYGSLLSFRLTNIFIMNQSSLSDSLQKSFSNNLTLSLGIKPISIHRTTSLKAGFSLEQFMEMSRRNFTSGGIIINVVRQLGTGISLEGFYSAQSRRKTKGWFIEGTTSQDLSLLFRVSNTTGLSGWISLSYDPKRNEWRTSFAELSLRISEAWRFQTLACYDFLFRKLNNIDVFLARDAGRFELRFVWRSLSKQIVVELIPQ